MLNLISNMGWRYVFFRSGYELRKRLGLLQKAYPTSYEEQSFISLEEWRKNAPSFFFASRESLGSFPISDEGLTQLKEEVALIKSGKLRFFSASVFDLGADYDWMTNPDTGYHYDSKTHWTQIPDFDPQKGDIKYVWEKSRFSFLYPIIRLDKHTGEDQSEFVLQQITDWIDRNPLNCGPNYVCSQETSLRMMNWTFALYYYRNAPALTEERFQKIINSIYWQLQHVKSNIQFSRIAVRNNHAVTETLMLLLGGVLFPFFPGSIKLKRKGLRYFQKEVLYQVYRDGSYIQYSFNYQRVVVQLFSWATVLCRKNGVELEEEVKNRMHKCMHFLLQHQDEKTGQLPNYGANDGALFFPLSSSPFRDYRPQLAGLSYSFHGAVPFDSGDHLEEVFWWHGQSEPAKSSVQWLSSSYKTGGYYTLRHGQTFSFIRCGKHHNRPSQADNLHLDIWVDGVNLLRDAGSYKYNASEEDMRYFMGTSSHNTVQLAGHDQMLKGGRFIWYHWSQAQEAETNETDDFLRFEGIISAYRHVHRKTVHKRSITQYKQRHRWEIEDQINTHGLEAKQIWNLHPDFEKLGYRIASEDVHGKSLEPETREAWYSSHYGVKEKSTQVVFRNQEGFFRTIIEKV